MNEKIIIPSIEEAETFRLGDSIETLAEKKTAERVATRVAAALALTHDGYSDGVQWTDPLAGDQFVNLLEIDADSVHLETIGGPRKSIWIPLDPEDWDHGVAYVLAMLTILQNPEETGERLAPALYDSREWARVRQDGERDDQALARWMREDLLWSEASTLVRSQWREVGETADEVAATQD